jgi:oligoendopeptidase F
MRKFSLLLLLALIVASVSKVSAQSPQPQNIEQAPVQQQTPAQEVSNQTLKDYLEVQHDLIKIQNSYANALKNAQEKGESMQPLRQQMQDEMVKVVKNSTFTLEEFNQLAAAVQQSPELQNRLRALLK